MSGGDLMGRKNHRVPDLIPDDITPAAVVEVRSIRRRFETDEERERRLSVQFGRRRERNEKRNDQRVLEAIGDWDHCCIPGCEEVTSWRAKFATYQAKDASKKIPVCIYHETIIGLQVQSFMADGDHDRVRQSLARRHIEEEIAFEESLELVGENGKGAPNGQIYVIRQGGLIKVGWSSKLRSRLKQYGAGVEILAHYPATRAEETDLHRSLRPFLARGREWYQDCRLLADVVADIHKRYGEPTIFPYWTVPKPDQAARPKGFPAAR
jgi:hypothetical protein